MTVFSTAKAASAATAMALLLFSSAEDSFANAYPTGTFVHLFEWSWMDIAYECETWLGPKGYDAVQVSPPMEHIQGDPWWTRYQPVSYNLESRSGSKSQFVEMVNRCKAAGVGIIVDGVINHMAFGGGTGNAGSEYGDRTYPGLYSQNDFHYINGNPSSNCQINDYYDRYQVQNCDLVGLPDLNTGASYVQNRIAEYLASFASLGVAGVRIDAAKHIDAGQLKYIVSLAQGMGLDYVFTEVISANGEPIQPEEYFDIGQVTEFNYGRLVGAQFKQYSLANLINFGEEWGLMPRQYAVTFIDNHDTERENAPLTYRDGSTYELANVFMLANPYGYPKIMSGYEFAGGHGGFDQGPPGTNASSNCFTGSWTCMHRRSTIANMVAWRNLVVGSDVEHFQSDGQDRIAFSRGSKAFVAINRNSGTWGTTLYAGLPSGQYCNIIEEGCEIVEVREDGYVAISARSFRAVAIHTGAMASCPGGGLTECISMCPPSPPEAVEECLNSCSELC